jgi:uncharacterized protein (DUF2267 family)
VDSHIFVKRVAEVSGFDKEIAERVVRATLLNLGTRIDAGEADDLAAQLPDAIGACLRHKGNAERFPPSEFVRRVACVVPLSNKQGPGAIRAVFTVLSEAVGQRRRAERCPAPARTRLHRACRRADRDAIGQSCSASPPPATTGEV